MKKNKRVFVWLMAAVIVLGIISGCGKKKGEESTEAAVSMEVSAAELVKKAQTVMNDASSVSGNMNLRMVMDYSAQGVEASLEMTMNQKVEMTKNPEASHMSGTLGINLSGISMDMESYVVKDKDSYMTYTKTGSQWVKQSTQAGGTHVNAAETLAILLKNESSLVLEGQEEKDGKQLYKVSGTVSGDELLEVISSAGDILGNDVDSNGDISAQVTMLIDAVSGIPAEMTMDFTESYNALIQANIAEQGFDEASVTEFVVAMSDYEFDKIETIAVPDEVIAAAVDMDAEGTVPETQEESAANPEEPSENDYEVQQDGEGNYVLETDWDESTVSMACPSGFSYDGGSDKTYLKFNSREDDSVHQLSLTYGLYTINDNYSEADLAQYQESSYAYMQGSGDYSMVSYDPVQTIEAGGRTVSYTKLSYLYMGTIYCEEYNSWTVFADGRMVQCTVTENSKEEPCNRIDAGTVFEAAYEALKG